MLQTIPTGIPLCWAVHNGPWPAQTARENSKCSDRTGTRRNAFGLSPFHTQTFLPWSTKFNNCSRRVQRVMLDSIARRWRSGQVHSTLRLMVNNPSSPAFSPPLSDRRASTKKRLEDQRATTTEVRSWLLKGNLPLLDITWEHCRKRQLSYCSNDLSSHFNSTVLQFLRCHSCLEYVCLATAFARRQLAQQRKAKLEVAQEPLSLSCHASHRQQRLPQRTMDAAS